MLCDDVPYIVYKTFPICKVILIVLAIVFLNSRAAADALACCSRLIRNGYQVLRSIGHYLRFEYKLYYCIFCSHHLLSLFLSLTFSYLFTLLKASCLSGITCLAVIVTLRIYNSTFCIRLRSLLMGNILIEIHEGLFFLLSLSLHHHTISESPILIYLKSRVVLVDVFKRFVHINAARRLTLF